MKHYVIHILVKLILNNSKNLSVRSIIRMTY